MIADLVDEWPVILIAAVVVALAMVLTYRLMNRDPDVRRTRYGFFVERDRYRRSRRGRSSTSRSAERTLPNWPDRDKTAELPPEPPASQ